MKINISDKLILLPVAVFLAIACVFYNNAVPEFLLNDDIPSTPRKETPEAAKRKSEFPSYIATNIKAQLIPNVKGAVRISWEVDTSSSDDFIIGRTRSIPDTKEKALNAISIKVVPAGAQNSIIDSNLAPGEYYYVVLSKEKVMSRDVEIYPDVNYTTTPVIIEREVAAAPSRLFPEQVALIHAQVINKTQVVLTWKGVNTQGIVYTVYRGNEPLSNPDRIRRAEKLAAITDNRESFIDRNIAITGTYYYAVTTRDISGNEDLQLIPDQSYLTSGINVAFKSQLIISNLKAVPYTNNSVKLTWNGIGPSTAEYLIYRYTKPISDTQRLALATFIDRVKADATTYIDKEPGPGEYYYAVLVRLQDSTTDNTLKSGSNYTLSAITILPETKKTGPEKIKPEKQPEEPVITATGDLDAILRETFFKEHYSLAIKKLNNIIASSDNDQEKAKAKLFIGRSHIELGQYQKSLQYLLSPDVARYYPRESSFWREYAISRIR